ncbi:MAG TPA: MoxR family ATPase [Polyangia bacterium]|jgi:MoxR-like ATPase|nr:MoxR family ATPase [Polyangia bacterium]
MSASESPKKLTPLDSSPRPADVHAALRRLVAGIGRAVLGKEEVVRLALTAFAARGHILIEDVPGVGKTTLARALARAVGGVFRRIQFTSDLLPADIVGVSVWQASEGRFEFRPGPIFANVVLADEINRTTPRTQSSLLEVMSDGQVSVDGVTYPVPNPFLVIATQNPLEHFGTYPLPESQMDRFLLRLRMGYPDPAAERRVVTALGEDAVAELEPVVELGDVLAIQAAASRVRVDEALLDYAERLVRETRRSPFLALGVSPRGFQGWYRAAQAHALLQGRDYAVPDDLKRLAVPTLAHRVLLAMPGGGDPAARGREEAERVLLDLIEGIPVPT